MKKGLILPTILLYAFLAIFLVRLLIIQNFEFIGYLIIVAILFYAILLLDKKYNFPPIAIWLVGIWIVSHILGGALTINGTRLYDLLLVNLYDGTAISPEFIILKYDQLIHTYSFFAFSILSYFALKYHFKKDQKIALTIFAILVAIGIGVLNEVLEFGMVIFLDAADAVGGYYNTALDLVFNLIGAALGATFAKDILDKKK